MRVSPYGSTSASSCASAPPGFQTGIWPAKPPAISGFSTAKMGRTDNQRSPTHTGLLASFPRWSIGAPARMRNASSITRRWSSVRVLRLANLRSVSFASVTSGGRISSAFHSGSVPSMAGTNGCIGPNTARPLRTTDGRRHPTLVAISPSPFPNSERSALRVNWPGRRDVPRPESWVASARYRGAA
ncbi:hypothetical protein D3C76_658330 [compost metagenome]